MAANWKTRLDPFATAYSEFRRAVDDGVRGMTDQELAALLDATDKPTQSNCWWATYQVAPIVKQRATYERSTRAARDEQEG